MAIIESVLYALALVTLEHLKLKLILFSTLPSKRKSN